MRSNLSECVMSDDAKIEGEDEASELKSCCSRNSGGGYSKRISYLN